MNNILITILGRGGSKGVPGKNIRPFLGAPLIALSIYDAHHALDGMPGVRKRLAVDSDDQAILDVARRFLDEDDILHLREKSLAGDATPKSAAIRQLLLDVEAQSGNAFDFVIDLDITSPLRIDTDIDNVFRELNENASLDAAFSVVPARRNPYFNMVERHAGDETVRLVRKGSFTCRQDAPEVYEMNASIYAYRSEALRNFPNSLFDLRCGMTEMKDYGVLDIDSPEDHRLMQLIFENICLTENPYFAEKLAFARRILRENVVRP